MRVAKNWALTQRLTIGEQLRCGVRYLDLRVCASRIREREFERELNDDGEACNAADFTFVLCHSLASVPVETALDEVREFLESEQREVVLLDFNHLYAMNDRAHAELLSLIHTTLQGLLCPSSVELHRTPLASLIEHNVRDLLCDRGGCHCRQVVTRGVTAPSNCIL